MSRIKGVIFDLDGTLVNTLFDIANSVNYALSQFSLPTYPAEYYRLKIGKGNDELIGACLPEDKRELKDKVLPIQLKQYSEHFCDNSKAYPGVKEMLLELKKGGIRMGVLSNKPAPFAPKLVEHVFGKDFFDVVHGELKGVPLKPDPTSTIAMAKKMGLEPAETAFVGDSGVDMQTAKNAGMLAVGVTWGFRERAELEENGSDVIIDEPKEFSKLLKNS